VKKFIKEIFNILMDIFVLITIGSILMSIFGTWDQKTWFEISILDRLGFIGLSLIGPGIMTSIFWRLRNSLND